MYPVIKIGIISIYTYTLAGLLGILFGIIIAVYADSKEKPIRSDIFYCTLYCVIGGLIGGKTLYLLTIIPILIQNPELIINALSSGMVFYGGLIGGILGGYVYVRQYKQDFLRLADNIIVGIPVGHFFGRLGCFAAGCCYGKPYDGIFSVVYPEVSLSAPVGIAVHPVQLYEAFFNLCLFFMLWAVKRKSEVKGMVLAIYLFSYGIGRFIFESLRNDTERGFIGLLSTSQFISIFIILAGIFTLVFTVRRKQAA